MSWKKSKPVRMAYAWASQFVDPLRAARAFRAMPSYWRDYLAYRREPGAEALRFADLVPVLDGRTGAHELDAHYFFMNAWAVRRIGARRPSRHVDVGSQTVFAALLSAFIPTVFIDFRPLAVKLPALQSMSGSLAALPLRDGSVSSLSCLHVAEHVGLGRYGDPLDPAGTRKAARELARVLAPGGDLYFALPIGRPRVAFNAHRIHSAEMIVDYFSELRLREFSGVDDGAHYMENAALDTLRNCDYGCGLFWFTKS
jgi:SAM-dependent methyltransferase